MQTTNELIGAALTLMARLYEGAGEVDEQADPVGDWLEAADDKIGALAAARRRLKSEADLLRQEEQRLAARRRSMERGVERVSELATDLLIAEEDLTGSAKIKRPDLTAWLARTTKVQVTATPQALCAYDPDLVIISSKPDRREIKRRLEAGEAIGGCELAESRSVRFR